MIRQPVELFLDIEGIPDQRFYYLMGLLVCEGENCSQHSFWADTPEDEGTIWKQLLVKVNEYPEAPIYHYGSYEPRAFNELAKKYSTDIDKTTKYLININSYIYGKIYFPVFSNTLKEISNFIGFLWTEPNASGLQSLIWRYNWELKYDDLPRQKVIAYNLEDCFALKRMTNVLSNISDNDLDSNCEIKSVDEMAINSYHRYGKSTPSTEDLNFLNEYAYFNKFGGSNSPPLAA